MGLQNTPTIVLVPSPLILPRTYAPLLKHLRKTFSVEVVSLPATALRFSKHLCWSSSDYALFVSRWLEARDMTDVLLIGHSNSGPIVVQAALLEPERLRAIVICASVGVTERSLLSLLKGRLLDLRHELLFFTRASFHILSNFIFNPFNFFRQIEISCEEGLLPYARKCLTPALVIWGAKDNTLPVALIPQLMQALPKAQEFIFEKGSHDWLITHPKEFAAALSAFAHSIKPNEGAREL